MGGWHCIRKGEDNSGYRAGDCKVTPLKVNSSAAYDDVCVFRDVEDPVYTCPTVPTFKKGDPAQSCAQEGVSFACFSLREGVTWSCLPKDASKPSCISTEIPVDQRKDKQKVETYDGICVHGMAAKKYTTTTTTSQTTTSQQTTT